MGKSLGRIVDSRGNGMTFSQGKLRISYGLPQETPGSILRPYINSLKARIFEIANYFSKII